MEITHCKGTKVWSPGRSMCGAYGAVNHTLRSGCHGTAWTYLPGQSGLMFPAGVGLKIGTGNQDLRHLAGGLLSTCT